MPALLADGRGVDLPFSELGVNHSFTLFLPTLLQLLHRFAAGAKTSGGPCALSADGRVARDATTPVLEQAAGLCRRTVVEFLRSGRRGPVRAAAARSPPGAPQAPTAGTAAAANRARLILWCRWKESNPRPSHYECAALPTELHRREGANYSRSSRPFRRCGDYWNASVRNSVDAPFHVICTPMHSRMNADSRSSTAVPVGPSLRMIVSA